MRLFGYTYLSLILILMASLPGWSQPGSLSNERELWLHNQKDSFLLSTLTIIPETFKITSDTHLPSESFRLDGNYFIWNTSEQARQNQDSFSFRVNFRVIPYEFNRWKSHFDSLLYKDGSFQAMESISFTPFVADDPLFSSRGIQYDGSFARGLSVGNSQDLVLNSNFDLRLNGSLGDGIEVLAALSDNSIPLQPEGNTQQLQEFDKIFIQLKKGGNTLTGGDFELSRPQSYFTNYFKKTQGVRVVNQSQIGPDRVLTTAASAGGSRGKFARIQVSTQEGNQGPYRLQGSSGERFIIILAGTEKIYLDGVLLVRGLERDYIIDYNSGELTFTANRIITKDTRIIAEYEYSDQNYNRSIYTFETDYHTRKFDFHFNAYSEQDGKLSSGITDLSTEDKRFLAELGDQTDEVLASSIRLRPEGYDPNIVMYKLIDSLGYPDILVRSTNPDSALYTARFTLVGDGKGDYIRIASESNGEVYAWVAPGDNGLSTGNYAPVAQLVAPQQRQMFAAGTRFDLGANGDFSSEVALSKIDLNRFSSKDAQDDYGYAISNSLQKTFYLSSDSIDHAWQISTNLKHEMLSKTFQPLNPYRPAEFVRDWNLNGLDAQQEHLVNGTVQLQKPEKFDLQYAYGGLFRKSIYQGNKHVLNALYKHKGFRISATGDWLKSTVGNESSLFTRPKFDLSQALDKEHHWQIGVYFEQEKNARRSMLADTLTAASFYYDLRRIYLRRANDENLNVEMSYQKRFDYFASGEDFAVGTEADDFSVRGRWARKTSSILDATLTLRNLDIKRINPQVSEGGLNYVGKINHQFNLFEGAIRTTTAYEIGSGQEPKRTYQYLKVDPGQGVYTFLDQNGDGIQQINEFEIAPFAEQAEYVRITVLTNDFIATNNVTFNQSFNLDPRRSLKNKEAFFGRWSDQGSVRILRKNLQNSGVSIWSPFTLNVADSALVSISAQLRNVLYFNRSNPKYDLQYEWNDFRNRFVLTTGYESKQLFRHILRSRMNFHQEFSGLLSLISELSNQDSENFDNKDFKIQSYEIQPELNWQPSTSFRLTTKYRYADKQNQLNEGKDRASIHDLKSEATISKVSTSSLRGSLSLVLIEYQGPRNGSLEFAMLNGLKNGTNWIWGIGFDRRLANNIRLNLSYDGRKSGSARVVHTARAQVSAFF